MHWMVNLKPVTTQTLHTRMPLAIAHAWQGMGSQLQISHAEVTNQPCRGPTTILRTTRFRPSFVMTDMVLSIIG